MTESEWLTSSDSAAMLSVITRVVSETTGNVAPLTRIGFRPVSDRKLRLFACACVRSRWHFLTDPRSRTAVEVGGEAKLVRSQTSVGSDSPPQSIFIPKENIRVKKYG